MVERSHPRLVLIMLFVLFFFFKQKTAYEMRISDWSSDVCSSDLIAAGQNLAETLVLEHEVREQQVVIDDHQIGRLRIAPRLCDEALLEVFTATAKAVVGGRGDLARDAVIVATFAVAATELGDQIGRAHV